MIEKLLIYSFAGFGVVVAFVIILFFFMKKLGYSDDADKYPKPCCQIIDNQPIFIQRFVIWIKGIVIDIQKFFGESRSGLK